MLVLGIETSTMTGSVALLDEDKLISEYILSMKATHSVRLMPAIDMLLRNADISRFEVNCVAVSIGPGSFTGLRIGLATAKGLAMGLNVPLVGVPTLDAIAWNIPYSAYQICTILDARKKEVYTALFQYKGDKLLRLTPYQVMPPLMAVENIRDKTILVGDGAEAYKELFANVLGELAIFVPNIQNIPRASVVAQIGLQKALEGETLSIERSEPIYIRDAPS